MSKSSNVRQTRARRVTEQPQSILGTRRNLATAGRVVSVNERILRPRAKFRYGPYTREPDCYIEKQEPTSAEDPILPCTVCLNDMHPRNGVPISSLSCGHVFCTSCIKRWTREKSVCPTCMQTVKQYEIKPLYLSF